MSIDRNDEMGTACRMRIPGCLGIDRLPNSTEKPPLFTPGPLGHNDAAAPTLITQAKAKPLKKRYGAPTFVDGIDHFVSLGKRKKFKFGLQANPALWMRDDTSWCLKPGVFPSQALDDMVSQNAGLYVFDCANFVYFAQLYGVYSVLKNRFDSEMERSAFTFNFYKHKTHFIKPSKMNEIKQDSDIRVGADITLSLLKAEGLKSTLKEVGRGRKKITGMVPSPWENEHVIKLGGNSYFAWGLPLDAMPADLLSIKKLYARQLFSFLKGRSFVEFGDDGRKRMTPEERIAWINDNLIWPSSVFEVVLPGVLR